MGRHDGGRDVKIVIHSRYPHHVSALLLDNLPVGLFNRSTGEGINFVRTDPPLLWRRRDAVVVVGIAVVGIVGYALSSWSWPLVGVPAAVLYGAGALGFCLLWCWVVRAQVDRALDREASVVNARSKLRRVKYGAAYPAAPRAASASAPVSSRASA